MNNLVIVESPSKAKTIKKYLGKGYVVKASKGHVVDLPKSKISVDVENGYEPVYEVTKAAVLKDLRQEYKDADKLILAVDLDREGEAIGWHLAQKLGAITKKGNAKKGHSVERIVFSEITKDAIQEAIKKPREINMDLVNAQQARRILDRLVGYKLSPILWKKITFGLSAGRVQSVALKLVVDKEEEREAFKPDEYWKLFAWVPKDKKKKIKDIQIGVVKSEDELPKLTDENLIQFDYVKANSNSSEIKTEKDINEVLKKLEGGKLKIKSIESRERFRNPTAPFITSTLQQTAINSLGFTSKKTMSVAQKLYEKGFITYMRTDSTNMSAQAINAARTLIKKKYGQKYLSSKVRQFSKKSKAAQEAHECIRPVDFKLVSDKEMNPDMEKLYKLIWGRTLATQMSPAKFQQNTIKAEINSYEFKTTGSKVLFDGYLKVIKEKINEVILPAMNEGETYDVKNIFGTQHFTQPPARYSEASLIKKLEELGIGRPSTYSSIISTIVSRKYVEKEGRYLSPTLTGRAVNGLLAKYFSTVVDYDFTSKMENDLDKVAEGKEDWVQMLDEFYKPFEKEVIKRDKEIPREEFTKLGDAPEDMKCPICDASMHIKLGRYGKFYSCSRYPDCKGMRDKDGLSDSDISKFAEKPNFHKFYKNSPKSKEGKPYELKKGKFGFFWAHPDYPKVKDAKPLTLKKAQLKKIYGEIPQTDKGKDYVLRNGRYGEFWAHPDYPKKRDIVRIIKKDIDKEQLDKVQVENL